MQSSKRSLRNVLLQENKKPKLGNRKCGGTKSKKSPITTKPKKSPKGLSNESSKSSSPYMHKVPGYLVEPINASLEKVKKAKVHAVTRKKKKNWKKGTINALKDPYNAMQRTYKNIKELVKKGPNKSKIPYVPEQDIDVPLEGTCLENDALTDVELQRLLRIKDINPEGFKNFVEKFCNNRNRLLKHNFDTLYPHLFEYLKIENFEKKTDEHLKYKKTDDGIRKLRNKEKELATEEAELNVFDRDFEYALNRSESDRTPERLTKRSRSSSRSRSRSR